MPSDPYEGCLPILLVIFAFVALVTVTTLLVKFVWTMA